MEPQWLESNATPSREHSQGRLPNESEEAKFFRMGEVVAKDSGSLQDIGHKRTTGWRARAARVDPKEQKPSLLETWTETKGAIAPVNSTMIKIQLTIAKAELQGILDTYNPTSLRSHTTSVGMLLTACWLSTIRVENLCSHSWQ